MNLNGTPPSENFYAVKTRWIYSECCSLIIKVDGKSLSLRILQALSWIRKLQLNIKIPKKNVLRAWCCRRFKIGSDGTGSVFRPKTSIIVFGSKSRALRNDNRTDSGNYLVLTNRWNVCFWWSQVISTTTWSIWFIDTSTWTNRKRSPSPAESAKKFFSWCPGAGKSCINFCIYFVIVFECRKTCRTLINMHWTLNIIFYVFKCRETYRIFI